MKKSAPLLTFFCALTGICFYRLHHEKSERWHVTQLSETAVVLHAEPLTGEELELAWPQMAGPWVYELEFKVLE